MKTIIIALLITLMFTGVVIGEDIKPFQLTVSDWEKLQKDQRTGVCLYYLFEVYGQGRLKKWVRRELKIKRYALFMAGKLSELISITIIKERNTHDNIFKISMCEMAVHGWL